MLPLAVRRTGVLWVAVSLPLITASSAFVTSPDTYVFVLIFMACGAYTLPALLAAFHAVRHAPPGDRVSWGLLYAGLISAFLIGVGMLVGVVTGWTWGNAAGVPAVAASGLVHTVGVGLLVRTRSGRRALSIDVIEALGSIIAVAAPLVVLWGPAVVNAQESWFTMPAGLAMLASISATYWALGLCVRLGPGRGALEVCALGLCLVGALNAALQTAQGISGFTLAPAPFIALNALCMSMYLLIPLHVPLLLRAGLDRLPPQAQVRGARMSTMVALAGLAALLASTLVVAEERPWAVPFALGVVSLLFVLGALRQMAAVGETRRLYRQVEVASGERQRLLSQLLERSVHDRRRFAGQMYEQAIAAYTSFSILAGEDRSGSGVPSAVSRASALVGGDLARQADSVRELVQAIRPLNGDAHGRQRLSTPISAYLATIYGDLPTPKLSIEVEDDLVLDWVAETVLLQVVQEALHNVWRHSRARAVDVKVEASGDAIAVRVVDDGIGFDAAAVPEGMGIATMRASAAVIGGSLVVESRPGVGTSIAASLGPSDAEPPVPDEPPRSPPRLRVIRN